MFGQYFRVLSLIKSEGYWQLKVNLQITVEINGKVFVEMAGYSGDVFEIKKGSTFNGLLTPDPKQRPVNYRCETLEIKVSPMSTKESFQRLRMKYKLSIKLMTKERQVHTQQKGTVAHNIKSPQKLLSKIPEPILSSASKSLRRTLKPQSQKKTRRSKRNIDEVFQSYFANKDVVSLMVATPPSKQRHNKVKLLERSGIDDSLFSFHIDATAMSASAPNSAENDSTPQRQLIKCQSTPTIHAEYVEQRTSSAKRVITPKTRVKSPSSTVVSSDPSPVIETADNVDELLAPEVSNTPPRAIIKRRSSTMDYDNTNSQHIPQPSTPVTMLRDCVQFSAQKMSALVRSVRKHDQSVRKSMSVSAPDLKVVDVLDDEAFAQEQQELDKLLSSIAAGAEQEAANASPLPTSQTSKDMRRTPLRTFSEPSLLTLSPLANLPPAPPISTSKCRTACRKSVSASLSSVANMIGTSDLAKVSFNFGGNSAVKPRCQSTPPRVSASVSSPLSGLGEAGLRATTPVSNSVMSAVRSNLKSRKSMFGAPANSILKPSVRFPDVHNYEENDGSLLMSSGSGCCPVTPVTRHHANAGFNFSVDSAMKFNIDTPAEYRAKFKSSNNPFLLSRSNSGTGSDDTDLDVNNENNSYSDLNVSATYASSGFSKTSRLDKRRSSLNLQELSAQKKAAQTPRTKRNSAIKSLIASCDTVLNSINAFV